MRFKRHLTPNATVNLVPMIDVIFQLVIFFMVTSTELLAPIIALKMPESRTAENSVVSRLIVTLTNTEEIYLNKERMTMATLQSALEKKSAELKDQVKVIVIQGDKSIDYAFLVRIMDLIRSSGFNGVYLKLVKIE